MKKIITLMLLALLGVIQSSAQEYEYVPFLREGVKWVCVDIYGDWIDPQKEYFTLELQGDTIIDGKTYKAMHKYGGSAIDKMNDTIPIYLREESKVVYGIVPDGTIYPDCPIGVTWSPLAQEIIKSGQEFVLYDFTDMAGFIKDNFNEETVMPCHIVVGGKRVSRYIYGDASCVIEGIGYDGEYNGYPLSALGGHLCYVIEQGDTVYTSKSLEEIPWYIDVVELPIPRQGVKWVNERVTVENGDTTLSYYRYEFRGYDGQGYAFCFTYPGETMVAAETTKAAEYQSGDYKAGTSNGMIRKNIPFRKVRQEGRDMMNFISMNDDYLVMYHFNKYATDITWDYTPSWYIDRQKEPFLTRDNFVEVEPLIIEDIECKRFAYIGEDGDTLAYVVEGIGFDSRDLGDLLTPFTRKPDPEADYQEWCGLSHVVKDGKIIYKGMRYHEDAFGGIDEAVADKTAAINRDENYYDLMGRKLGRDVPTTPGIYIHQGQKIVVR